jgi:hypothetical protein
MHFRATTCYQTLHGVNDDFVLPPSQNLGATEENRVETDFAGLPSLTFLRDPLTPPPSTLA